MQDDAAGEVALGEAAADARRVAPVGLVVPHEVKRRALGRKASKRVEELEDALPREPVRDAEEGGSSPGSEVGPRRLGGAAHVSSGRDDADPLAGQSSRQELLREVVARGDEEIRSRPGEPVERDLSPRAKSAVVDPAGRLVEDSDDRNVRSAPCKRRRDERGGDRVDEERMRAERPGAAEERRSAHGGERERALREREKHDARAVGRRGLGHAEVVEVPSAQPARVAERHEGQEKMRVVHVAPTLFGPAGIFGGGERYPLELARALAAHVDCELVTFGPATRAWRDRSGLRVRVLRSLAHLGRHPAHPVALGLSGALAGADVVHTHHMRSAPSRLAALMARVRRGPTAVTDHGLRGGDWAGLLPRLFDRFLTVSAYSARELAAPPARTRVVYGGAEPGRFFPDADVDRRGLLFVGRLTPHKGVDRLIEALPAGAALRVVGSAGHDPRLPERDYPQLLKTLAAGRDVEFLGPVPEDDLPALYRSAQALVLPSVHRTCYGREIAVSELLGLAALEAMASGTPVVASRVGGLPEVVEDGVTGFLVEPGDVRDLRERLEQILGDTALAARLGRNGRERVVERFTWDACAGRCLEEYGELV